MILSVFKYEFKNSIKMMRNKFIAGLIMISILTVAFAAVSFVIKDNSGINRIIVAIVHDEHDKTTDMVIRYISQMDSVKTISEFKEYSKDEAFKELNSGNVSIVLNIPNDMYNAVNNGENPHLEVYIRNDSNYLTKAFAVIIESGVKDVAVAEASVYSFMQIEASGEYEFKTLSMPLGDYIASIYADIVMHRTKLFSDIVISDFGQIDAVHYYFCTILITFMLFFGNSFGFMHSNNSKAVRDVLKTNGISAYIYYLINTILTAFFVWCGAIIIYVLGIIATNIIGIDMDMHFIADIFILIFLSVCEAMFINIFKMIDNSYLGNISLVCIASVLLILSGAIIPLSMLPKVWKAISYIDPVKYMFEVLLSSFSGFLNWTCMLVLAGLMMLEQGMVYLCEK